MNLFTSADFLERVQAERTNANEQAALDAATGLVEAQERADLEARFEGLLQSAHDIAAWGIATAISEPTIRIQLSNPQRRFGFEVVQPRIIEGWALDAYARPIALGHDGLLYLLTGTNKLRGTRLACDYKGRVQTINALQLEELSADPDSFIDTIQGRLATLVIRNDGSQ